MIQKIGLFLFQAWLLALTAIAGVGALMHNFLMNTSRMAGMSQFHSWLKGSEEIFYWVSGAVWVLSLFILLKNQSSKQTEEEKHFQAFMPIMFFMFYGFVAIIIGAFAFLVAGLVNSIFNEDLANIVWFVVSGSLFVLFVYYFFVKKQDSILESNNARSDPKR